MAEPVRTLEEIADNLADGIAFNNKLPWAEREAIHRELELALREAVAQAKRTPEDAGCYICGKRNRGEHGHETFYLCPEHPNVHLRLREQGAKAAVAQERAALREWAKRRQTIHSASGIVCGTLLLDWLDAREKSEG